MADAGSPETTKLKVFISYSRKDAAFAQDLLAGLEVAEFDAFLDKEDIAPGEAWEARLGRLIESADAVVYVISPDAIASARCAWEVERTVALKKRLLPVVCRSVEEAQVPAQLKQLNYIFFDRPFTFGASLRVLAQALRTDIDWIREHTRLGEAAIRWDGRGRLDALLLRGEELAAAQAWLKVQPRYAAEPTTLMHELIRASENAEAARTSAERQRLDQLTEALQHEKAAQAEREKALDREKAALARAQEALGRSKRALAAVSALVACVVVGTIGWYNQDFIEERWRWYTVMRPYMNAHVRPHVLTGGAERDLVPGQSFRECAAQCPEMVVVPAGSFTMGSPDSEKGRYASEGPRRSVVISRPLAVAKTAVTFDQWDVCVSVGGCPQHSDGGFGRGTKPVINVNWSEARQYAAWLSLMTGKTYRLLTESEWEYAARAGTTTAYWWGDDIGTGNANCKGCGSIWDGRETAAVGSFRANAFGLFDVHGNVWQWVEDCYEESLANVPLDGTARVIGEGCRRSVRGGSWYNSPGILRAANRTGYPPDNRVNFIGFRVARELGP